MSEGVKAKLSLDAEAFNQGLIKAMSAVEAFSKDTQKELAKIGDEANGITDTTEASSQRQVQSWSRVGKAVGAVALISSGLFKSMVNASPSLSAAFAEMNFMFEEMFMVLGEQLAPIIEDTMVPAVEKLTEFIISLDPEIQTVIASTIGLIAALALGSTTLALFGVSLGGILLPITLAILAIAALALAYETDFANIGSTTDEVIDGMIVKFTELSNENADSMGRIGETMGQLYDFLAPIVETIVSLLVDVFAAGFIYAIDIILAHLDFMVSAMDGVITIVKGMWNRDMGQIMEGFKKIWDAGLTYVTDNISATFDFIKSMFNAFGEFILDMVDDLFGSQISGKLSSFMGAIASLFNIPIAFINDSVISAINSVLGTIETGLNKALPKKWEVDLGAIPDIPTLHGGGVVPGPTGQEVPIMALGGEVVYNPMRGQSPSNFGGSKQGKTINNYFTFHNPQFPDRSSRNLLTNEIESKLRKSTALFPSGRA